MSETQTFNEALDLWRSNGRDKLERGANTVTIGEYKFTIHRILYKGEVYINVHWNDELIDQWRE